MARAGDNLTLFEDWTRSQLARVWNDLEAQAERLSDVERRLTGLERDIARLRVSIHGMPAEEDGEGVLL